MVLLVDGVVGEADTFLLQAASIVYVADAVVSQVDGILMLAYAVMLHMLTLLWCTLCCYLFSWYCCVYYQGCGM